MWSDIETSKDILSFSVHLNKAERDAAIAFETWYL